MKTNNGTRTDDQLWNEVLDVLHDNRRELTDEEVETLTSASEPIRLWMRVAAIFIAAAFIGGLAYATYRILAPHTTPEGASVAANSNMSPVGSESEADGLILFADIRLDSMLSVVGKCYGKTVFFGDKELKGLRIHTKWNPKDSLAAFIESLNELDGLKLTEQRDTIFVQKGGVR